jgi:GTPase
MNNIKNTLSELNPNLYIVSIRDDRLQLPKENDYGSIEYKRTLSECDDPKAEKYATQMKWRGGQNHKGLATYYIGVDDDGTLCGLTSDEIVEALEWLVKISNIINASIIKIEIIQCLDLTVLRVNIKMKKLTDGYGDFDF